MIVPVWKPPVTIAFWEKVNIKAWQIIVVSWVLAPIPPLLLFYQKQIAWLVCPYGLCVMFARQAQKNPDSLGAAGIPDLVVALLQFPVYGFFIARALKKDSVFPTGLRIAVCHFIAILAAMALWKFRDFVWNFHN